MAASSLEQLHEEVTCPICLSFFREPVTLLCGHNFCRACIIRLSAGASGCCCPECRQLLEGDPVKLRPNRRLANVAQIARDFRLSWRKLSELSLCGEHTEQLRHFCETDLQPICVVCCMGPGHDSHTVLPIQEAAHKYKRILQRALVPMKEEMEKLEILEKKEAAHGSDLLVQAEARPREIISEFGRLHSLLDEEKDLLLTRLTDQHKLLKKAINVNMNKLSEDRKVLQNLIEEVEEKCQQPAPELLKDLKSTLSRCEAAKIPVMTPVPDIFERSSLDACPRYNALQRLMEDFQGPAFQMQEDHIVHSTARKVSFEDLLHRLQMTKYAAAKLALNDVQQLCTDHLENKEPQRVEDVPWHFLQKLMTLNVTARSSRLGPAVQESQVHNRKEVYDAGIGFVSACDNRSSVSPLDVLCVLLHCSDGVLQQEVLLKMSMCQFALPLLLPPSDGSKCTFLLWAMRDIVKKWRPRSLAAESEGFKHERLVVTPMPTISFVRHGTCSLSKSSILNKVLSHPSQQQDIFIHQNMDSGNFPRKIAHGLVEIAWYFPSGSQTSDLFPEPIAVANLRGDIDSHSLQFSFLTEVSSAIFMFTDCTADEELALLSSVKGLKEKVFFVTNDQSSKLGGMQTSLKFNQSNILQKNRWENEAQFVTRLQAAIRDLMKQSPVKLTLENMAATARNIGACVDEDLDDCQIAKGLSQKISEKRMIEDKRRVAHISRDHPLQRQEGLFEGIKQIIEGLQQSNKEQRRYLMKWMKFSLESVSRNQLRELFMFLCEVAEFGVPFFSFVDQSLVELPRFAANVLLDGFALELTAGKLIEFQHHLVTSIFDELCDNLGRSSRFAVITMLGMQGIGKSTLLNTMFGLQFPVSSGGCTHGASMSIIKVRENLRNNLGCDALLVIDTESLNHQHMVTEDLSSSQKRWLASLIGLSDIVIINMPPENAAEMNAILQIVVEAFLAAETVGKKPSCQFVHCNVNDVSDHVQNVRQRKYLQEELNRITKAEAQKIKQNPFGYIGIEYNPEMDICHLPSFWHSAAIMAPMSIGFGDEEQPRRVIGRKTAQKKKQNLVVKYSDIMEYDPETDNCYLPSLWHGVPPMAQVNIGFSEKVYELKRHLLEIVKRQSQQKTHQDILSFKRNFERFCDFCY